MRRLVISLLLVFSLGSIASAQTGNYAGASTGYPYILSGHYGMANLLGNDLDLRLLASLHLGGYTAVIVTGDALYHFREGGQLSAPYAGGGLTVGFGGIGALGVSYTGFLWNVHALGGYQYRFNPDWSAFGELNLGYSSLQVGAGYIGTVSASGLAAAIRLGVNYFF